MTMHVTTGVTPSLLTSYLLTLQVASEGLAHTATSGHATEGEGRGGGEGEGEGGEERKGGRGRVGEGGDIFYYIMTPL